MSAKPLRKLARDLGLSASALAEELAAIDATLVEHADDYLVSEIDQLKLAKRLSGRSADRASSSGELSLDRLLAAEELGELNDLLTKALAQHKLQPLIKEEGLSSVVEKILELNVEVESELLAASMMGRLAAVARGREQVVREHANQLFSEAPGPLEDLPDRDGKAKGYAAQLLSHVSEPWIVEYSYQQVCAIDTADSARRELLSANLSRAASISDWFAEIGQHAESVRSIQNLDSRLRRVRRVFEGVADIAEVWRGDVGARIGDNLADLLDAFLRGKLSDADETLISACVDQLLRILRRVIELRFSFALYADTYAVIEQGKKVLGPGVWGRFLDQSSEIRGVRVALLETALVLARQNRQDRQIMSRLTACYSSRPQAAAAIKRHFRDAKDLDPDVAEWWRSAGSDNDSQRRVEHKVGNNEDSQIGGLLIEVESNRKAMEKLGRAVVPHLEISEPVLASSVKKAVDGYEGIAQIARRLARMRKLSKTDLQGERLEYNPMEHEMLGGHQAGVRKVKVVRDGIKKDFAGRVKTLVKPWVEPVEEQEG